MKSETCCLDIHVLVYEDGRMVYQGILRATEKKDMTSRFLCKLFWCWIFREARVKLNINNMLSENWTRIEISINNFDSFLLLINLQPVSEIFAMSILYTNAQSPYITQKRQQIQRLRKKGCVTKKKFLSQQVLKLIQKVFNRISLWQMSEYHIVVIVWSESNFWFQHYLRLSF